MTLKVSTGLRNKLLDTAPVKTQLAGGFIHIYGGVVPLTADDALGSAVLLSTITINSGDTGINFEAAAVGDTITKSLSEVWLGTNVAPGTATFYRHVTGEDDGTASTDFARIQGEVGTSGKEMNLSSVVLASGAPQSIDYYSVSLPSL